MRATDDLIQATKNDALNDAAHLEEALENLKAIQRVHPECCTPQMFSTLRSTLQIMVEENHRLLTLLIKLCDGLLRERADSEA